MIRNRIVVAYDGRPFEGWQSQPSGRTVQDALEKAVSELVGKGFEARVHGSGRTDAGVHALGQVAHFDAPSELSLRGSSWREAMNTRLPSEIRVLEARETDEDFHARFSASRKCYQYRLALTEVLHPLESGRAWRPKRFPDQDLMAEALACFVGKHDFGAFGASRGKNSPAPESTVRRIMRAELNSPSTNRGEITLLEFEGNGFLYKMVRLMVGYAVEVGVGKANLEDLRKALDQPQGQQGGTTRHCAPPDGLYLKEVFYDSAEG